MIVILKYMYKKKLKILTPYEKKKKIVNLEFQCFWICDVNSF